MARSARAKSRRRPHPHAVHKPNGVIHPRVQAVGPEHFAFVCVDCAKARSKMMLADFYGRVLVGPPSSSTIRPASRRRCSGSATPWTGMASRIMIVVIERTGRYHGPVQRAFAKAGFEVRILHPYTTKQYRQPADPGNKTDDTDLSAIHRAAVNGFGLLEHEPDPIYVRLQLLARHRRRLVQKNVMLRQQMLEHLHSYMPGYSKCFNDIFDSEIVLWVAKNLGSAAAILQAGVDGPGPTAAKGEHPNAQTHIGKDRRLGTIRTFSRGAGVTPSPILHRARCRPAGQAPADPSDRERAGGEP